MCAVHKLEIFKMENYDLNTITRDQLLLLLSTAKDEMVKYVRCRKRLEEYEENCREANRYVIIFFVVVGILFIGLVGWVLSLFFTIVLAFLIPTVVVIAICALAIISPKEDLKIMDESEVLLQDLRVKESEAKNELKAVLLIPDDYCYEYALTKMLKFVENKRASSWKRVTDLYEEHLHRMTMEDNTRQILEQSKLQTELIKEVRDKVGWATMGAWASAYFASK